MKHYLNIVIALCIVATIAVFVNSSTVAQEKSRLDTIIADLEAEEVMLEELSEELEQKLLFLEQNGAYETAREILFKGLQQNFSLKTCDFWMDLDSSLLKSIHVQNTALTNFFAPERGWGEWAKKLSPYQPNRTWEKWWKNVLNRSDKTGNEDKNNGFSISPTTSTDLLPTEDYTKKLYDIWVESGESKLKLKEQASKINFTLLDKESIENTDAKFEVLRSSTTLLQILIKKEIIKADLQRTKELLPYSKKLKEQKAIIKQKRTQFISYDVVSPYLAEVTKQLFIAEGDWTLLVSENKEAFDKAIKTLSFYCYQQLLNECFDDVRLQFFSVQKKIKATCGKEEYEELNNKPELQDSNDPSKKRGADLWWE